MHYKLPKCHGDCRRFTWLAKGSP